MTTRTFAPWVEPISTQLRDNREQVIAFAESAPQDIWNRASPLEAWSYKDILGHLAGGNDQLLQKILRSVASRTPIDLTALTSDSDANARGVAERRAWSLDRLIAYLKTDGEETQELLSELVAADESLTQEGAPINLGEFLRLVQDENHDLLHLEQMHTALEIAR